MCVFYIIYIIRKWQKLYRLIYVWIYICICLSGSGHFYILRHSVCISDANQAHISCYQFVKVVSYETVSLLITSQTIYITERILLINSQTDSCGLAWKPWYITPSSLVNPQQLPWWRPDERAFEHRYSYHRLPHCPNKSVRILK